MEQLEMKKHEVGRQEVKTEVRHARISSITVFCSASWFNLML